jgi:hypothetical protein
MVAVRRFPQLLLIGILAKNIGRKNAWWSLGVFPTNIFGTNCLMAVRRFLPRMLAGKRLVVIGCFFCQYFWDEFSSDRQVILTKNIS